MLLLFVVERQAVPDSYHTFYAKAERLKGSPESMYVYSKTQGVERRVAPRRTPNLLGGNDTVSVACEPREDEKLFKRKRDALSAAGDVIVIVLYAKETIIVGVRALSLVRVLDRRW